MTRAHSSGVRVRGICAVWKGAMLEMNRETVIEVSFDTARSGGGCAASAGSGS